jgi:hypothetical protein
VVRDLSVRENVVRVPSGASGLVDRDGDGAIFEASNTFAKNEYHLAGNTRPFWGSGGLVTVEAWVGSGQDVDSRFYP